MLPSRSCESLFCRYKGQQERTLSLRIALHRLIFKSNDPMDWFYMTMWLQPEAMKIDGRRERIFFPPAWFDNHASGQKSKLTFESERSSLTLACVCKRASDEVLIRISWRSGATRSLTDRPWGLKQKCGQQFLAAEVECMLNYMIQPIFGISFGSLKLQHVPKYSTEFEFRVMKSRY